jgi:hypothetical protein
MRRLRSLSRGGRILVALAVGGAVFGIATAVYADIPDSGVINSCYGKTNGGFLRVIDTSKGQKCAFNENPLSWNAAGVTGASGATGATGPTGPTGPTGARGPSDGWRVASKDVVLAPSPAGGQVVNSIDLPAGSYFLTSEINSALSTANARPQCTLVTSSAGATVSSRSEDQTTPAGFDEAFSATGLGTATGPATFDLNCQELSGLSAVTVVADIIAIQVGTAHLP